MGFYGCCTTYNCLRFEGRRRRRGFGFQRLGSENVIGISFFPPPLFLFQVAVGKMGLGAERGAWLWHFMALKRGRGGERKQQEQTKCLDIRAVRT